MSEERLPKICPDCRIETLRCQGPGAASFASARPLAPYVLVCDSCDHVFQWRSGASMTQLRRTD